MPNLEVPAKADAAVTLPSLVLAKYLELHGLLPDLTTALHPEYGSVRLVMDSGTPLSDFSAIKHLANIANTTAHTQAINKWVNRIAGFANKDFQQLLAPLEELEAHLILRTHLVAYDLTTADLTVWATIRGNRIALATIEKQYVNVARWYNYCQDSVTWLPEIAATVLALAQQERAKARAAGSAAGASYKINLPGIDGPVVTRFPPEPSGYLHIGHVKAAILNDYFAHKRPGGILICRFDDTNPTKESMEFQDAILDDLRSLGIIPDRITYSSDYFQVMHDYAVQIIKDGKAFADDSPLGKGAPDRLNRLPSARRDFGIEETLARFELMKSGSDDGKQWCLRARIAYDHPNGSLRDPVIYRCNDTPHHRTGTRWKIYPTYDFCAPILDSIEGVTVALRTNEYRDRNAQYKWMQEALKLRAVPVWDFSRINFVRTFLSKRKLLSVVNNGKVRGWDDPRMPTVKGILRRGMTVPALREFIIRLGPSKNVLNLEWGALWATNKKYIDPIAPRHTAITEDGAVRCEVKGIDGAGELTKPKHAKNTELGYKRVVIGKTILIEQADAQGLSEGEEITLMNWGNAYVRNIMQDKEGNEVTKIILELSLEGDVKKTKKLTWLAATDENMIAAELISIDYLLTKDKLEKDEELESFLNPVTEFKEKVFTDCNVVDLLKGAVLQFDRKGFFKLDVPYQGDGSRMIFFDVPTGKS